MNEVFGVLYVNENQLPQADDMDLDQEYLDDSIPTESPVDNLEQLNSSPLNSKSKCFWTYEATSILINKYAERESMFADSIHTNAQVWDIIASEFRGDGYGFSGTQCMNRWKYIRSRYIKKKDNKSTGNTGGAYYEFEYFDAMDDILGYKENLTPTNVASSLSTRPTGNIPTDLLDELEEDRLSCEQAEVRQVVKEKEKVKKSRKEVRSERQERQHNEFIELQRESLQCFKDVMGQVLNVLQGERN